MSAIFLVAMRVLRSGWVRDSGFFEVENELAVFAALLQQRIARLLRKGGHVAHRTRISGDDTQHLPGSHIGQRLLLGFHDG